MQPIEVKVISGVIKKGDKKGTEWRALRLTIGDWSTVIFPKTNFEMKYIEKIIDENENE